VGTLEAGPKKIAIITSHPIQYHAPWLQHLANQPGLDIRVFYLWDFGVTEKKDAGFQQVIRWDVPLLSGYDYEFVPNVSADPGTHRFWGLRNPSLVERVTAYNPHAVLLMGYNYASFSRFIWRWGSRSPLLFRGDSHRIVLKTGIKEAARRMVIAKIFRRFSAFLYVGQANKAYFHYHRVQPEKLFFAPHAVDNERFIAQAEPARREAALWKQELGIPGDHSVILFAGKFEANKRPLDLLHAFIRANLARVTLLLVGAGPLEPELRQQATGFPAIRFAPFQNQSLMPRTYATADVVILPSFAETWGLTINEAMCMARPVIVSSHVGCAEDLVSPNKNGLIFRADDIDDLVACLKEALSDRERLRNWGQASLRRIQDYSYGQTTRGLKAALAHLNLLPPRC
jgi:glycosyltransferase involved in cell wall biosynthesis